MKPMLMSDIGWCKAMRDVFSQHGLNADALFAEAGIATGAADVSDLGSLTDAFSRAWELAVAKTGNPAIGLTLPMHPLMSLGVLSHVVLAASDLRGALRSLARFTHLASPTASMEIHVEDERCRIALQIAPGRRPVAPQRYDFLGMTCVQGLRWVTGRAVPLLAFHHPGREPAEPGRWREAFGCPVRFDVPACLLELSAAELALPIPTADPTVSDLCERIASQIAGQQGGSVSARVRQVLLKHLSKGDPRRESVASLMHMSERTLQRRLTEEGTCFAELVDEVRREAAERYFAHGDFSATEITFALGFADPSNFYRACKRWFGRSPSSLARGEDRRRY
jgi:AraC-like DNA-binding protein